MCEERERQENELREQREWEERELEEMIRAEQVCLEEEKRRAEEEERHLDEAHREWLWRLEEARQAPEEEEEAEAELSAPKKRKVREVVSYTINFKRRLTDFFIEDDTFLPPMQAGRKQLLQENTWTWLLKLRRMEDQMQRGRRTTEKEGNGGRKRENGEGEKSEKGRGFREWRRRENRGIEEDHGSIGRNNGGATRVDRGSQRSNGGATGNKVGDGSVDEEARGKGTEMGKGER